MYPRVGFIVTNLSRPAERVVAGTCVEPLGVPALQFNKGHVQKNLEKLGQIAAVPRYPIAERIKHGGDHMDLLLVKHPTEMGNPVGVEIPRLQAVTQVIGPDLTHDVAVEKNQALVPIPQLFRQPPADDRLAGARHAADPDYQRGRGAAPVVSGSIIYFTAATMTNFMSMKMSSEVTSML